MRIVILAGEIPSTTFIDSLINGMAERGYTIVVIGKKTGSYNHHKNIETIEVPKGKFQQIIFIFTFSLKISYANIKSIYKNSNTLKLFFYDLLFYLPILSAKPNKVHIQWASSLYQSKLLFDLFPGKILLSLRGAHINYVPIIKPEIGEFYRDVFPKVHKFHAVSNAIAQEAEKYGADIDKIQTIYTSVANTILQNEIVLKNKPTQLKIITVGRFHWKKGYNYLIDALSIVKKHKTDFKLILIAGNNIPEDILYSIHQNNLNEEIRIVNNLPHAEVLKQIKLANLMVLSSVEEGIANVVIEAMALGTPVISSDCGGMKEVIKNGINGFLFENRNVTELANKIIEFYNMSSEKRNEISLNAKDIVMKYFSKDRMLDEFEIFYR